VTGGETTRSPFSSCACSAGGVNRRFVRRIVTSRIAEADEVNMDQVRRDMRRTWSTVSACCLRSTFGTGLMQVTATVGVHRCTATPRE
jgi:hypothetical protein